MLSEALKPGLIEHGMAVFAEHLSGRLTTYYASVHDGHYQAWLHVIKNLPDIEPSLFRLDADEIVIGTASDCDDGRRQAIQTGLKQLGPWRKGPFTLFGLKIDSEWRSDMKWARLSDRLSPLDDRAVLDVGCGNGYYGWRMLGEGAKLVIGIDPALRYVMQHRAISEYLPGMPFDVFPFTLEEIAEEPTAFDTVFSMGVIYHQRTPQTHIQDLSRVMRPGGELILESLIIDEDYGDILKPKGRYAKMKNARAIPSVAVLQKWLLASGFADVRVVDISTTTPNEQRVTAWSSAESLSDFLNPDDPHLTIEGYPAPKRALLICNKH